jgi:hypothetical protein
MPKIWSGRLSYGLQLSRIQPALIEVTRCGEAMDQMPQSDGLL